MRNELVQLIPAVRRGSFQGTLFPSTVREIASRTGARMVDLHRLHDAGLLSFSPESDERLDPAREMELGLLSALSGAGFDLAGIRQLTRELQRPLTYEPESLVFHCGTQRWMTTAAAPVDEAIDRLIEQAIDEADVSTLLDIAQKAAAALAELAEASVNDDR